MKIYAAIIGKNEEKALPKCLNSLNGFDGIFYTDTGSTDKSIEIAKKYNANISYKKWENDFSKVRNYNLDQIPKDAWVFVIDCDEFLPKGEIHKIKAAIEKSKTGHCFVHEKNLVDGGEHQHLRFFKNNIRYKDAWHAHIPVKDWDVTDVLILHQPSIQHKKNPERNIRILKTIKNPSPRILFLAGREYMGYHKYKLAIKYFQRYFKVAGYNHQTAEALVFCAQCFFQIGETKEAQNNCLEAIKFNPEYKEALIAMATFCEPWKMKAWLRYAKTATNDRITSIMGRQDERIEQLETVAEMLEKGKTIKEIEKTVIKKK